MSQTYTIKHVQKRDEWASQYGGGAMDMADYAITLEEDSNGWIKLTQKVQTPPPTQGSQIYGSILTQTTKNGNSFRKFKRENQNYQNPATEQSAVDAGKIDYIIKMLEELTDRRPPEAITEGATPIELEDDPFKDIPI